MTSFIASCCCKGKQPYGIVSKKRISRPEVVGRLLVNRRVARFMVASAGYGKTHVAFEYANIIFAFRHVVWMRCASPCFLRDLDAGDMDKAIFAADEEAALVVFDELPVLDPKRTEALSQVMDALLEAGCEVIVACSPSSDTFTLLQRDRIVITAKEMLLEESEVAALGLADVPHGNIACIAWGTEGVHALIEGCAKEPMPADVRCAIFCMIIMGSGALDKALSLFDDKRAHEIAELICRSYTFLGVDGEHQSFDAVSVPIKDMKATLLPTLDDIVGCTPFSDADSLGIHLADTLIGSAGPERAHDLVLSYLSAKAARTWVLRRGWQLIFAGEALCVIDIIESTAKKGPGDDDLIAMSAWALWALGQEQRAAKLCPRVAVAVGRSAKARASAWALLTHLVPGSLDAEESFAFADVLAQLQTTHRAFVSTESIEPDWLALGQVMLPVALGSALDVETWNRLEEAAWAAEEGTPRMQAIGMLLFGAAWTLPLVKEGARTEEGADDAFGTRSALVAFLLRSLKRVSEDPAFLDGIAYPLMVAHEAASEGEEGRLKLEGALTPALSSRMAQMHIDQERQVRAYAKAKERKAQRKASYEVTHPDPFRRTSAKPTLAPSSVPQLDVRLFGGLEVRIDGTPIDPRKLTRQRARTLASALALNKGHELTRDKLCQIVWPEADPHERVNSFYSVWASLKRALTVNGTCPYLVRSQIGCSFDARYLSTDIEEFDALCTSLVFGGAEARSWEDLYAKVTLSFAETLLPGEVDNPYIIDIRERCKHCLVDGLLAASRRLLSSDERTGALWFAREALRRDDSREDVHIALMEAQIAADQRGPALETYFKCRRFLSEGLGIDPSPHLVELYRSIIEYEEEL